jgi:tight adherence protein B
MSLAFLLLVFIGVFAFVYSVIPFMMSAIAKYKALCTASAKNEAQFHFLSGKNTSEHKKEILLSALIALLFAVTLGRAMVFPFVMAVFWLSKYARKKKKRSLRLKRLEEQLPEVAQRMADSIKAGLSLKASIEETAIRCGSPFSDEIHHTLKETELGVSLSKSLSRMAERIELVEYSTFCSTISIAQESGGKLSDILDSFAASIRERRVLEGRIRSLTAQGKMQGFVLAMLPVIMLGAVYVLDSEMVMPLFTTSIGQLLVLLALVLEIAGIAAIRKVINVEI